ncbi:hypothetical protein FOPG_19594 [Fusarium oxysporum f. sp. conglutinans race 2 54008]|uniref:Uncharacterized protein n=1 Tax=Fusarium oxysporum f. sp. conglutinans race 2 54008 TaxID=1089457 RepID=X0GWC8_FUSOX|nr:hypothetical protein FOPG_19594 [Fusarium oxysporum f. sp. conglutinans race 2 54008]
MDLLFRATLVTRRIAMGYDRRCRLPTQVITRMQERERLYIGQWQNEEASSDA